jgi:protein-disulfide isomerase
MSRQRIIILILCILFFALLGTYAVVRIVYFRQNNYRVGSIPPEIVNQLLPKDVSLSSMRPPALRASDPVRFGYATSLIAIVEYGDYQCPGCRSMDTVIQRVAATYGGKVRVVWRDALAEGMHPDALSAAIFARCAGLEGKYWQAHDDLMKAERLNEGTLIDIAGRLRLDMKLLAACRKTPAVQAAVRIDTSEAQADGIKSVPFFYVGTQAFDAAVDAETLKAAVDRALNS